MEVLPSPNSHTYVTGELQPPVVADAWKLAAVPATAPEGTLALHETVHGVTASMVMLPDLTQELPPALAVIVQV